MGEVLVEVVSTAPASGDLGRRVKAVPEDFDKRADEVMAATLDIADRLRTKLDEGSAKLTDTSSGWGLREVDMTFGLTLRAEAGVIVAKLGGDASFGVTLMWKRNDT